MELIVASELLAEDELTRAQDLARYFGQLAVQSRQSPDGWQLTLSRPVTTSAFLDPELSEGLDWWTKTFTAIEVEDIFAAVYRDSTLQIALEDSWTLYAWSSWLTRVSSDGQMPTCVTLLHLDEHDDLMTPRLVVVDEKWQDVITGAAVDMRQPDSIAAAIRSGAISIGNFIAPLGHWLPELHIRHLRQSPGATNDVVPRALHATWHQDTLLAPGCARPALELGDTGLDIILPEQHTYKCATNTADWLADLPPGPILLHIDLDYFNNRYEGNPDWKLTTPDFNPQLSSVLVRIDEVFENLEAANIEQRIVDYTVAVSPGFFPASMWAAAAQRVLAHIYRLRGTTFRPVNTDAISSSRS